MPALGGSIIEREALVACIFAYLVTTLCLLYFLILFDEKTNREYFFCLFNQTVWTCEILPVLQLTHKPVLNSLFTFTTLYNITNLGK